MFRMMMIFSLLATTPFLFARDTDRSGLLYGTITMKSGTEYRGVLRWGTEEAFWDDIFNSSKTQLDHQKHFPKQKRKRKKNVKLFGVTLSTDEWTIGSGRQFMCQFGVIDKILVTGEKSGTVVLKTGSKIEISGGSNDVGRKIHIEDESLGPVEVKWSKVDTIDFSETPEGLEYDCQRLYGVVETSAGAFEGFIQWDAQESMDKDELDGHSADGELSIKMGRIRSIERKNRASCWVTLHDEREVALRGTNDVNQENRGIYVEDERFGRVKIMWDEFERVTFKDNQSTGHGYSHYGDDRVLRGTVLDKDHKQHKGTLVFDLDEEETWEMLNGSCDGIEYMIPFRRVSVLKPQNSEETLVSLKNGEELSLEGSADVALDNMGVLVLNQEGQKAAYILWENVAKIAMD